jgi:SAM-dependent methyltransferase
MKNLFDQLKYYFKRVNFIFFDPKVECNICGWKGFRFNSDKWHPHTICPNCSSQVRQRLLWAAVNRIPEVSADKLLLKKSILHFAPEKILRENIKQFSFEYKTADMMVGGYRYPGIDYCLSISDLNSISNKSFDCVIALDVLEHARDHIKAMEEVHRILRDKGCFIVTVPQKDNLKTTMEDVNITDPLEREKIYGEPDHLRIYGDDFTDLLARNGFDVFVVDEKNFDEKIIKKYVLFPPVLSTNPLATNHRKIFFARKIRNY